MCRPTYFDVAYSINPWMNPAAPVNPGRATAQWERLRALYASLGHWVEEVPAVPGLPDMVFAANGATVLDGRVLVARFRHGERAAESSHYREWFEARGWESRTAKAINEGEGDFLCAGGCLLAGTGFRTESAAHAEAQEYLGRPVVSLTLVDPRFYHLDTALTVLDEETIAYYPPAFSSDSLAVLRDLFPDAVISDDETASVLGLNAVSDGRNVVLPRAATTFAAKLRDRGYRPLGTDLSELRKAGGGIKCCTLEIRPT
jgi:N-dimethylarginine dimethylaminohydrolase